MRVRECGEGGRRCTSPPPPVRPAPGLAALVSLQTAAPTCRSWGDTQPLPDPKSGLPPLPARSPALPAWSPGSVLWLLGGLQAASGGGGRGAALLLPLMAPQQCAPAQALSLQPSWHQPLPCSEALRGCSPLPPTATGAPAALTGPLHLSFPVSPPPGTRAGTLPTPFLPPLCRPEPPAVLAAAHQDGLGLSNSWSVPPAGRGTQ